MRSETWRTKGKRQRSHSIADKFHSLTPIFSFPISHFPFPIPVAHFHFPFLNTQVLLFRLTERPFPISHFPFPVSGAGKC